MNLFPHVTLLFLFGAVISALLLPILLRMLRAMGLERPNFAGEPVLTGAGLVPALAVALVAVAAARVPFPSGPLLLPRMAALLAAATATFAALGLIDDLWGSREAGGFRGHLRLLLRERRVTTGLVKAVGGGAVGLAIGVAIAHSGAGGEPLPAVTSFPGGFERPVAGALQALLVGIWIALAANAINLLDLRPLRAAKGTGLLGFLVATVALIFRSGGAGLLLAAFGLLAGALVPYLPHEARRRVMLGDAGANALGAAVAVSAVFALPAPLPLGALTALMALFHLLSERHSLSSLIAARSWLRRLDAWGWQPPPGAGRS